jgi:hypothetical protein
MVQPDRSSWLRWLRPIAAVVLVGSWLAASAGWITGFALGVLLLTALVFPMLWAPQFGSWRALFLLLAAVLVPALVAAARWPELETTQPMVASALLLAIFSAWLMLPATIGVLMWRRFASVPLMLLGMAIVPLATLLVVLMDAQRADAANANLGTVLRLLAAVTPMWFALLACCLGPIFFFGSFVWLLYREQTRGA